MSEISKTGISKYVSFLAAVSITLRDYDRNLQELENAEHYIHKFTVLGRYKEKAEAEQAYNAYIKDLQVIEQLLADRMSLTVEQARQVMSNMVGALKVHEEVTLELARIEHSYYILDKARLLVDNEAELEEDESSGEPLNYLRERMDKELAGAKYRVEGSLERLNQLSERQILVVSA